jgi:PAS domain S-box-containing protein
MNKSKAIQILLIEDNRADAVLLRDMLEAVEPDRFELVCDDRLAKALARLRERSFDAMLLDLNLPDSRGLETLETLHAAAEAIPIVVVTGAEDENLAVQAIREGAQDYLVKGSLSAKGIARVIRYAIDRKRVEESLREAQRREMEAQAAAEAARAAQDTINAMSEGVLLLDMRGQITSVNPAMERLTGFSASAVLGRPLKEFIPKLVEEGEGKILVEAAQSAIEGRLPVLNPFTIQPVAGGHIPVIPTVAFIRGPQGEAVSIVVTLRDISALTAAREALAASEKEYRELVESANSIIMRRRQDGTITFINEFAQSFFGFREEELVGHNVVGTIVPSVETTGRDLAAMIRNIGANPEAYSSNENENTCKDGRRVWVQWTNRMLPGTPGRMGEILCVGVDATARKTAEAASLHYQQRLRSLANRLASTEEEERRRVSRHIHDTVIQSLALANIKLGALRKEAGKVVPAEGLKILDTVRELINEGIGECRQLMSDLTPAMLYELGLEHALEDLVEKLAKQHDVDIRLVQEGEPRPMEIALRGLLFQSTRELIVNALKHAGAARIQVSTRMEAEHVRICVKDDGAGLDSTRARDARMKGAGGFGLFNLRERVEGLGGRFEIASEPGAGTTAVIVVPLAVQTPPAG